MHHWIETVKPINHSSHAILKFWERVSKAIWNSCKGRRTRQRLQTAAVWAGTAEPLAATARWSLPRFAMFRLLFLHHDVYFTALFHCKQKASFSTSPPLLHSKPKVKQNTKPPSPLNSSLEQLVHSRFLDSFAMGSLPHTSTTLFMCPVYLMCPSRGKGKKLCCHFFNEDSSPPQALQTLPGRFTTLFHGESR